MGSSDNLFPYPPEWVLNALKEGLVIPAHPLALTKEGAFDERSQRALTRYYLDAGVGGLAVAVHTTQFAIRQAGLLQPVLSHAIDTVHTTGRINSTVMIAGITGQTDQARLEAQMAREAGYHVGLLSLAAFPNADDAALIRHARAIAQEIPLMGFYLQPAVGGRVLKASFWTQFAEIPNVVGIKVAPFDRYRTLDVLRGVGASSRANEIALYTGNDDHILLDLITQYEPEQGAPLAIKGGLLGHWACWTSSAVGLMEDARQLRIQSSIPRDWLIKADRVTEMNAALFDVANNFAGCIAGIQYVLHRQGLIDSMRCLDPDEGLSAGQQEAIEHIRHRFPSFLDDAFVAQHRDEWRR